ncbi:conserved hypothetical protein [Pyrenophora tritici-repentis Pt-1C-BFP]|uniref:ubiquitinyl hydrolase 1 n=1 Tax=Pyrenophora tritici-repentis (strain Pt-1C-BFP) TaxID=426418 RepID=B2WA36_PYRTR|nr:uncharacterized protein PTRG_06844 [Pyrenophora tritici-repentis Pt-1C-BFP]EDU49764.1 conserved hypothetical protein [Pyrenophora tritici-repentis Pt-1C-BFP]
MADPGRDALLHQLYNHVVLPRDVPGQEDPNLHQLGTELARRLCDAVKQIIPHAPLDDHAGLHAVRLALSSCLTLNVDGRIDKHALARELWQLEGRHALILHVTEQNAALLIHPHSSGNDGRKSIIFEAFETSATSEEVLASDGALQWDFPGQAIAIPHETFLDEDFRQTLVAFLEQSSLETIKQFAAVTTKASASITEVRDTPNPTLVTGWLMAILEASGAYHDTLGLRKRVRDTVSFHKAFKPWRRSPFYLVLRVGIQRHLYKLFGPEKGRVYFKTIMCMFLSNLLIDGLHAIPNDASYLLSQKLGSRLAKLEQSYAAGAKLARVTHHQIFSTLGRLFTDKLLFATKSLKSQWDSYTKQIRRIIHHIPPAARASDLELKLLHSGLVLDRAVQSCTKFVQNRVRPQQEILHRYEKSAGYKPITIVTSRYLCLYAYEEKVSEATSLALTQDGSSLCFQLADTIQAYVAEVGAQYNGYPEFRSRQLLTLMEIWKAMDEAATQCYPLLAQYHPGFDARVLDVLELSTLDELSRLQIVQSYIAKRCSGWCGQGSKTIFDAPNADSYAARAYDECDDMSKLQELRRAIEKDAEDRLTAKKEEWEKASARHESMRRTLALPTTVCPGFRTEIDARTGKRPHKAPCAFHKLNWEMKQMKINTHEHPLPESEPELKALVFELLCPSTFAAYRDATWLIISTLAHPPVTALGDGVPLLRAHKGLCRFANKTRSTVTLGSVGKPFTKTHWETSKFPTPFQDICYPFAMSLRYYDTEGGTWTSRASAASFAHLLPLKLPTGSPYLSLQNDGEHWPTSNVTLATQTQCPQDLTPHEFTAWQSLLLGTYLRWPCLLREMGSTNLNFSTASTSVVISRLCLQAGPASTDDILRDTHSIFHDVTFCLKLLEQVDSRLETIRRNWREAIQLDILLSILLKVNAMNSSTRISRVVSKLLGKARAIAAGWYKNQNLGSDQAESGPSIFAIWAAVLYKRTVYSLLAPHCDISSQILADFIIMSIALQECLVGFRGERLVIRAEQRGKQQSKVFELIDRSLFSNDLPAALVEKCYHWVDLAAQTMEIRQQEPFKSKLSNWRLDLKTRRATRNATRNAGSTLVDPHCALARSIAENFSYFEFANMITVYQPPNSNIRVELHRLELHFVVNRNGSLLCPQLGAIVAETAYQDVGTWHGLRSKLVMRSIGSPTQFSVLLPMGSHVIKRHGPHVSIVVRNKGEYLKFEVNNVLGRIECPAEPLMLYYRALWHALTAHPIPDVLTGRTGVEEALQYLTSGAYRPWTPLNPSARDLLLMIAKLSPRRGYYPPTMKKMESVTWDPDTTVYMQDDRYRRAVNDILLRNAQLQKFSPPFESVDRSPTGAGHDHLENRALSRVPGSTSKHAQAYLRRDGRLVGTQREHVISLAKVLFVSTHEAVRNVQLARLFENTSVIGGYVKRFDMIQITDILEADQVLHWGPLVITALKCSNNKKFHLTFLFCLLAFSPTANMQLLRGALSFALLHDLRVLRLPKSPSYNRFVSHEMPTVDRLMELMEDAKQPYVANVKAKPSRVLNLELRHNTDATDACRTLATSIVALWPSKDLDRLLLTTVNDSLLDREEALALVRPEWNRLVDNDDFSDHLVELQTVLSSYPELSQAEHQTESRFDVSPSSLYPSTMGGGGTLLLKDVLTKDISFISAKSREVDYVEPFKKPRVFNVMQLLPANSYVSKPVGELSQLVAPYESSTSMVHRRYGVELQDSIKALVKRLNHPNPPQEPFNPTKLAENLVTADRTWRMIIEQMRGALRRQDAPAKWLDLVGLWPRVTIRTLLSELRSTSGARFGVGVKKTLIDLGLAITRYQRLLRIQRASSNGRSQQLSEERVNAGHTNWKPEDHVDWLILEIDNDIMLRPEQVDVALATISPQSGENSVTQLLMGKGKTSCILHQQLMHAYGCLHNEVQLRNGIVLALPEHILSFKLSGIQRLCDGKVDESAVMIKIQDRFDRHARDVLDECDVTLGILNRFPHSIEVVRRTGVSLFYFLRDDVEVYLLDQMVQKICRGQTSILPLRHLSRRAQQDIRSFITEPLVDAAITSRVMAMFGEKQHLVHVVLHLRGLLVYGILLSTLKKRWNVQYGLHPTRDPIAVPYQAKGVPSPTSEWGHPDVAIILTCLSFYYEGLSMAQFKRAFNQLAKSNEPSIEYGMWVAEGVPEAFKNYNGINVEDSQQLSELHQHVNRYKVCLLDSFMNSFVFPQHAKQFSDKLSASGSDLVLYDPMRCGNAATTGFSGTNDTRHQLPMAIKQNDLLQLAHSNAEVLSYLLEDRNRRYVRMVDPESKRRLSETDLLRKLLQPGTLAEPHSRIRILIDAGAQILEHSNLGLVKAWLDIDTAAKAAVYFDTTHRAMVAYRKGMNVPLVATPFVENLEECLVYLDESHCRGTDLKLPPYARAAVTLGPHLTKDALAQAAMRMRLLGKSQSVTFFVPPEVHQSILDVRSAAKAPIESLGSPDVIRWLLQRSCNAIDQLEPLYYNQSVDYLKRTQAKLDYPDFLQTRSSRKAFLKVVRAKEQVSLKELYEPKSAQAINFVDPATFAPPLRLYATEILQRRRDLQDRGMTICSSSLEEVEQEREVEFELECVREVQPPVRFEALPIDELHRDIKQFATTGRLSMASGAFEPMFCALRKSALGFKHGTTTAASTPGRLLVSTQFTRTVDVPETNDNFLRPCHWLLWHCQKEIGMLVSPEEADRLIPILRNKLLDVPTCHLIVYAAPLTRHMLHFNDIDYYAIPCLPTTFKAPTWLKVELGIFAGRLYFEWNEYDMIMSYLGMEATREDAAEFVPSDCKETFTAKPLAFLHDWLAVRRSGLDFEHTPVGFITTGKPLSTEHSFFAALEEQEDTETELLHTTQATSNQIDGADESDDEDYDKEHLFQHNEDDNHDDFHDAQEAFDVEGNTFFDGEAYEPAQEGDGDEKEE